MLSLLVKVHGHEVKPIEPLKLDWMEDAHILESADQLRSLDDEAGFDYNRSSGNHSIDDGLEVG